MQNATIMEGKEETSSIQQVGSEEQKIREGDRKRGNIRQSGTTYGSLEQVQHTGATNGSMGQGAEHAGSKREQNMQDRTGSLCRETVRSPYRKVSDPLEMKAGAAVRLNGQMFTRL